MYGVGLPVWFSMVVYVHSTKNKSIFSQYQAISTRMEQSKTGGLNTANDSSLFLSPLAGTKWSFLVHFQGFWSPYRLRYVLV